MSHWFSIEDFAGRTCADEYAKTAEQAIQQAKSKGVIGPIVTQHQFFWNEWIARLTWLDRKIAMKPPIDFNLLNSMH